MTIVTSRVALVACAAVAAVLSPGSISCGKLWMTSSDILVSLQVIVSSPNGISCADPDITMSDRNFSQRHGSVALLTRSELLDHNRRVKVQ